MPAPTIEDFMPSAPGWEVDWDGIDRAFPWIRRMRGSTQDPVHHGEGDVWTHTAMVVSELVGCLEFRELPDDERKVLFHAALLHDVAKPMTRTEGPDRRITNPHHSRMGANEARQLLWAMDVPFGVREQVCALIAVHQAPFHLSDNMDDSKVSWKCHYVLASTSLQVPNRFLAILADADARGRISPDRQRIIDNVGMFRMMASDAGCEDTPYPFHNDHSRMRYFRSPETRDPMAQLFDDTDPAFTVTLASGLPGSGKSTLVSRETGPGGSLGGQAVVSMDSIRLEMGVPPDGNQGRVRQEATARMKVLLARRQPFVWDAINLDWQRRQPLASMCQDYGARVRFLYVEGRMDDVLARNRARQARVPDAVMDRLFRKWEPPTLAEAHEVVLELPPPIVAPRFLGR